MTLAKLTQKYVLIVMERVSEIGKKLHFLSKFSHWMIFQSCIVITSSMNIEHDYEQYHAPI